jgi:hypothetical protein
MYVISMQFKAGHSCYSPQYWLEHDHPYEFNYRNPCEPYFIALKDSLPKFDGRFRGRFRDKVAILTHMAAWGTRFFVNPDYFIFHLPHEPVVPLHTLSKDRRVHLYTMVVPHVLTDIMLQETKKEVEFYSSIGHSVPGIGAVFEYTTEDLDVDESQTPSVGPSSDSNSNGGDVDHGGASHLAFTRFDGDDALSFVLGGDVHWLDSHPECVLDSRVSLSRLVMTAAALLAVTMVVLFLV